MTKIKNSGEIRIPSRLLSSSLRDKLIKPLRLFTGCKLNGHRCEIDSLLKSLKIHPKTGNRLIQTLITKGWVGSDGEFLFPRSWSRLLLNKRGGLYITSQPKNLKKFEALCFAMGLKQAISRKAGPRPDRGRTMPTDLPTTYLHRSLGLSKRKFERLKSEAQKYGFITSKPQVTVIGKASEYPSLRKHLMDRPVFVLGKFTVVPGPSKIKVKV